MRGGGIETASSYEIFSGVLGPSLSSRFLDPSRPLLPSRLVGLKSMVSRPPTRRDGREGLMGDARLNSRGSDWCGAAQCNGGWLVAAAG